MKILNELNEEINNPDLSLGYLKDDVETVHHDEIPAVKGIPPKVHYEVVKEYPNGGQDLKEVIDEEGIKSHDAIPAWDGDEQIQRYILYTAEELKAIADAKAESERLSSLPTVEERLKATEDAIMTMALGGTSNV